MYTATGSRTMTFPFTFTTTFTSTPQSTISIPLMDVLNTYQRTADFRLTRSVSTTVLTYSLSAYGNSLLYSISATYLAFNRAEMEADVMTVPTTAYQASPYNFNYTLSLKKTWPNNQYQLVSFLLDFKGSYNYRDTKLGIKSVSAKTTTTATLYFEGQTPNILLPVMQIYQVSVSYLLIDTAQFDSNIEFPEVITVDFGVVTTAGATATMSLTRDFVSTSGIHGIQFVNTYINSSHN
jgi:hypothetical protein